MASVDVDIVRNNLIGAMLDVPKDEIDHLDKDVNSFLSLQLPNGSWPDINYDDPDGRSWWQAGEHLRRTVLIATAWRSNSSSVHGNQAACASAKLAIRMWCNARPPQTNWWWYQLGEPRSLGKAILLLDLPAESPEFQGALYYFEKTTLPIAAGFTGCNRVWAASVNIIRAAIERNSTRMAASYKLAYSTIAHASQGSDGIQDDWSFSQHSTHGMGQLYSGWGYGGIFSSNVLAVSSYASGTSFSMPDDLFELFASFVLEGQGRIAHGPNWDFAASGRLFTYFVRRDNNSMNMGHYHGFAAFTPFRLAYPSFAAPFRTYLGVYFHDLLLDPALASRPRGLELIALGKRLASDAPPSTDVPDDDWHYWDADYHVYSGQAGRLAGGERGEGAAPSYMAAVRTFSNRTLNTECVNDENQRGRDLADGVTVVHQTGREYEGVYPVWNWHLIPGTIEHQGGDGYECSSLRKVDHMPFVGGASLGNAGASYMHFRRSEHNGGPDHAFVEAGRLWLFAGEAMVQLVGGLRSNSTRWDVSHSLEQSNLEEGLLPGQDGSFSLDGVGLVPPTLQRNASSPLARFVWHGAKAVFLRDLSAPGGSDVASLSSAPGLPVWASNLLQNGSLAYITQGPPTPISKRVFASAVAFGRLDGQLARPRGYAVVSVPGVPDPSVLQSLDARVDRSLVVMDNDPAVDFAPADTGASGVQSACWVRATPADGLLAVMAASVWPQGETFGPPGYINRTVHGSRCVQQSDKGATPLFPDMQADTEGMLVASRFANGTMRLALSNSQQELRPRVMRLTLLDFDGSCTQVNGTAGHARALQALPQSAALEDVAGPVNANEVTIEVGFPDERSKGGATVSVVCLPR